MRALPLAAAAGAALLLAEPARGQTPGPRSYVAVAGSLTAPRDSALHDPLAPDAGAALRTELGFGLSVALGFRPTRWLRLEPELSLRTADLDEFTSPESEPEKVDGSLNTVALMGNVLLDLPLGGPVAPYVGLGIGGASISVESEDLGIDDSATRFAYQALAGVAVPLTPRVRLVLGYRYFRPKDPAIVGVEVEARSHSAEVGVRVGF